MAISELDSNTPPTPAAGARPGFAALRLLRRRPLLAFYLLAYGITWLAWLPLVLSREGIGVLSIHLSIYYSLLGLALGPLLSTLVMTAATGGRAGLRALLDHCLLWRVGWQWYLRALIGVPIVLLLGPIMLPGAAAAFHLPPLGSILSYPITLVFAFLGAPLFEEPAWRGFALPRQQERFGPLLGALINGFFWGLWHLPLFLLPMWGRLGGGDTSLGGMMTFVLDATLFSVLIAWVVNSTRGSVFLAMVMAASSDAFIPYVRQLFSVPMVARSNVAGLIGYGIAAILLAVTTGARLDYQGESEAVSRRAAQRATALSARK